MNIKGIDKDNTLPTGHTIVHKRLIERFDCVTRRVSVQEGVHTVTAGRDCKSRVSANKINNDQRHVSIT